MRKAIILLTFLAVAGYLSAQTVPPDRHEVYGSYGLVSAQDILEIGKHLFVSIGSGIVAAIVTGGDVKLEDTDASGSGLYGVGYNYFLNDYFKVGLSAQYAEYDVSRTFTNGLTAAEDDSWFTLLVEPELQWVDGRVVQFYSGVGVGAAFYHSKGWSSSQGETFTSNMTLLAWQINPVGLRFGRAFGGYIELGFGFKGLINAGLSGRF